MLKEREKNKLFFTSKSSFNREVGNSTKSLNNLNNTVTTELDKKTRYAENCLLRSCLQLTKLFKSISSDSLIAENEASIIYLQFYKNCKELALFSCNNIHTKFWIIF